MLNYNQFLKTIPCTTEDLSSEIFDNQSDKIGVKKKHIAVKNLTRIMEATLKLSNRKGFHAMSLRDLSKEVGMTMGGLYLYFKTKDELIDLIQNQAIRQMKRMLTDISSKSLEPREALGEFIRYYLYCSEANRQWFYFLYMETRYFSPAQKKKAVDLELFVENIFTDILERGRREGVFRFEDNGIIETIINALLMEWFLKRHKFFDKNVSVDAYAAQVIESIERAISPGGKAI